MKFQKIINGFFAIILTGGVLLLSDFGNRKDTSGRDKPDRTSVRRDSKLHKGNDREKAYKFCMVHFVDSPNSEDSEAGIRDGLKRNGITGGAGYTMSVFNAQGDVSTMNSIADRVAADPWDIVFISSTPTTQILAKKIKALPLVFTNVGDPVKAGLGTSFTVHQPNVTGISTLSDFEGVIRLVIETIPGAKSVGTVFTPGEVNSVAYVAELEKAALKNGLTLVTVPANTATEVADAALSLAGKGIDAFTQISDNLTASCSSTILKTAWDNRIPYFAFIGKQVEQGAVAAVSRDYYDAGSEAAEMAVQILNGVSPADIPFQYVKKSNVFVNEDALKYFQLTLPDRYRDKVQTFKQHE